MNDRLLKACKMEETDKRPIWLMRQAGRYLPEYRKLRRDRDLLSICKDSETAAELTVLPVLKFGVDAAIVFADIVLVLEGVNIPFRIVDGKGPVVGESIKGEWDIKNLREFDSSKLSYVYETIRRARSLLNDRIPIIGFAGGPFTIMCYMVENGISKDFYSVKSLMYKKPKLWEGLMNVICYAVVEYLKGQVAAGARVIQLFDSWAGSLSPSDYAENVFPYVKTVVESVKNQGIPTIYFTTCTAGMLELLRKTGANTISVDWRVEINEAWKTIGYDVGIQGNLDPTILLAGRGIIESKAGRILEMTRDKPGHIFNLGHGVLPETPPENVATLVEFVHNYDGGNGTC
ncbi:MAG: uroporphyrinogen decarboxylase [Nitrososphaerota archaeon]